MNRRGEEQVISLYNSMIVALIFFVMFLVVLLLWDLIVFVDEK